MAGWSHVHLLLYLIYSTFPGRSDGALFFKPNCTYPPDDTNFVSYPSIRSTLGIFWSATSVIILCTWNVLHLNVPASRPPPKSMWRKMWSKIWGSRTKIKWMLFTILTPEFLMAKAISEAGTVRTHLANMGYFVLDWGDRTTYSADDEDLTATRTELEQAIDEFLSRRDLARSDRINISRLKSRFWALNASQWRKLESENIAHLPDTPDWQLEKLDSSSVVVKIITIIQVTWLILQLIARKIEGLPSAQLEISALAFAACSIVTYIAQWNRPKDLALVCYIRAEAWKNTPGSLKRNATDLIEAINLVGPRYPLNVIRQDSKVGSEVGPQPIPNNGLHAYRRDEEDVNVREVLVYFVGLLGGSLFGGLHCLAWNFEFPSPCEALGWRICSLATTCIPLMIILLPVIAVIGMLAMKSEKPTVKAVENAFPFVFYIFLLLYFLARLFLIVESIRSLFFLPPKAFVNTWSDLYPHWR